MPQCQLYTGQTSNAVCGIAGIFNLSRGERVSIDTLHAMVAMLRHRGPDGFGFHEEEGVGLAHARLSIIDLDGGWQPIHNEDRSLCVVFNGEIFNYVELRRSLEARGHRFASRSDTEVVVHLYEDYGPACLAELNGQFALAVWDARSRKLFLARDRVGIRPLFYARAAGSFLFASEVKALFADSRVTRELDPVALDQIFSFWTCVPPRTAFRGVFELPAGHFMEVSERGERIVRYWDPDFTPGPDDRHPEEYAEELRALLLDATRLQLRADVPVGAYLSGGLDSSVIATLIKRFTDTPVRTFSVTFNDEVYDESGYQAQVISHLGTDHSSIRCESADIGAVFPDVVWHTERPVLRTAPGPMLLLSKLVRDSGYKTVLTGEGADEVLAGYDIFKEAKIRRFLARMPGSRLRPLLLKRLYPYFEHSPSRSLQYAAAFFNVDAAGYPEACFAHIPRWNTTQRAKLFFSEELRTAVGGHGGLSEISGIIDPDVARFDALSQAQYLEIKMLLSGYILSSQGDRMAMANSIEGRFPFLDHRVMEFCFRLPPTLRLKTLTEKYLLKLAMRPLLPPQITARTKQPYMAPDAKSFFGEGRLEYVEALLSEDCLRSAGYFNPGAVTALIRKCREGSIIGFKDNMALVGILSTMLLHHHFIENFPARLGAARAVAPEEIRSHVPV